MITWPRWHGTRALVSSISVMGTYYQICSNDDSRLNESQIWSLMHSNGKMVLKTYIVIRLLIDSLTIQIHCAALLRIMSPITVLNNKVSKGAKIRSRYNQVPHPTQDTNGKVTNSQLDTTNESQEVSPFPAGDHKAHINRRAQRHSKHKTEQKHKRSTKEEKNSTFYVCLFLTF